MDFTTPTIWTGNTYSVKSELTKLGATWDATAKCWRMPAITSQADTVRVTRAWLKDGVVVTPATN